MYIYIYVCYIYVYIYIYIFIYDKMIKHLKCTYYSIFTAHLRLTMKQRV